MDKHILSFPSGNPARSPVYRHKDSPEIPHVKGTLYDVFMRSVKQYPNNECECSVCCREGSCACSISACVGATRHGKGCSTQTETLSSCCVCAVQHSHAEVKSIHLRGSS